MLRYQNYEAGQISIRIQELEQELEPEPESEPESDSEFKYIDNIEIIKNMINICNSLKGISYSS